MVKLSFNCQSFREGLNQYFDDFMKRNGQDKQIDCYWDEDAEKRTLNQLMRSLLVASTERQGTKRIDYAPFRPIGSPAFSRAREIERALDFYPENTIDSPDAVRALSKKTLKEIVWLLQSRPDLAPQNLLEDLRGARNSWVSWGKTIQGSAAYLSRFDSADEFYKKMREKFNFENDFEAERAALEIAQEIYGFGFTLACSFLKSVGFRSYCKPDRHVSEVIFRLGMTPSQYDLFGTFEAVRRIAIECRDDAFTPNIIDKKIFLICSGSFYLGKEDVKKRIGEKDELIKFLASKLYR